MALTPSALILRLSDDLLECIVSIVIADEDEGGDRSLEALKLSHICRHLRRLILARASFWTNLEIHSRTNPQLIYLVLKRSCELPLDIDVRGISPGSRQLFDHDGLIASDLLDAWKYTIARFASSTRIKLLDVDNQALADFEERLAIALGPNPPAVQSLNLCVTPCDPLLGLFGPHLTQLDLQDLTDFSLRWLSSILQLAPNLEIFRLVSPYYNNVPWDKEVDLDSLGASPSPQLQSLDVDVFEQPDFEAVVAVIHRIYPSMLLTGRRVLLSSFDNGSSVAKLDLQRFTCAVSLVIESRISYVVTFINPTTSDTHGTSSDNDVVRGFQCWPRTLHHDGPYLDAIRYIAFSVRSVQLRHIGVKDGIADLASFIDGLAQISWPCLEQLALVITVDTDIPEKMIWQPDTRRIHIPRLAILDTKLKAGWIYADREVMDAARNWDPFLECLRAYEAVRTWFNIPESVATSLVVEIDGKAAPTPFSQKIMESRGMAAYACTTT